LRDWALRYRTGGFEALAPKPRQDRGQSRAIPPQLADLIERLKRENPHRTGTTLLRELALVSGQNEPALSASTLYRFLKQRGLTPRQLRAPQAHKKFEAQHANQIWQSDVLYGPYVERPGGGKRQAFRHAILDDASRLVPHTQFYADQGLNHFLAAARAAAAEIIILDPLYSTHDPDENDTRAMAALCQSLLRLREASRAALIVVHHVRKSIGRYEIGSAFRGSSALHAVGDSYLRVTRPAPQFPTVEWRFQFRYAAPQPPRRLELDPHSLWFSPAGSPPPTALVRRKVEPADVTEVLSDLGGQARYNQLRQGVMILTQCSKRTAQLAITEACQQGGIVPDNGHYRLPCPGIRLLVGL
jgi:transposase